MFQIKTFNAIAPEGMARFDQENYRINESEEPDGIILRSQKLHDYDFPKSVLGIARAGAGTKYSSQRMYRKRNRRFQYTRSEC